MRKLSSYRDLQDEKIRSKLRLEELEYLIEEEISSWSLPHHLQDMVSSKRNGIVSESINLTVDNLVKNLLLRRRGWVTKFVAAYFLKNYANNFISKNAGKIFSWAGKLMRKRNHEEAQTMY